MSPWFHIEYDGISIGTVTFEAPNYIAGRRVGANGFAIEFPITVRLRMADPKEAKRKPPQPLLSNLTAQVSVQTREGVIHSMGYARIVGFGFLGSSPTSEQSDQPLTWTDTLATLALYEQIRGERPPSIRFDVRGEVCYLYPANGARLRSEPKSVHGGAIEVTYSRDAWVAMLKNLKVADLVILEVPVPEPPATGWAIVWQELQRARDAFERGGREGWTTCVLAVRRALEAWEQIEVEAQWPDGRKEREALTKGERLARLRWSLHQMVHPIAHADQPHGAEEWTREEARVALSTLCGLLAMRQRSRSTATG